MSLCHQDANLELNEMQKIDCLASDITDFQFQEFLPLKDTKLRKEVDFVSTFSGPCQQGI